MQPHDTTPTKICTKCGESKPATTEYFYRDRHKRDGLRHDCKACKAEYRRAYYEANKERVAEWGRAYREANKERKAEYRRAYYKANKERIAEQRRANHESNRERDNARVRVWYKANKERAAEWGRAYREANKERITERRRVYHEANRDNVLERVRAWRIANPEKKKAAHQRRRARKREAEGTHTGEDIQAQYKRQRGKCYWCGEKVGNTYHVDHIVPLARGGTDWPENLVIACPTCNMSKQDKLPHEWMQGGRLL